MAGFGLGNYINPAVGGFIDQRRNALAGLGAGLLNGQPGSGVQQGIAADSAYAIQQQEQAEREKLIAEQQSERNQTTAWLKANFPKYANLPPAQGWQAAMGDLQAQRSASTGDNLTTDQRNWMMAQKDPEFAAFLNENGGGVEFGLTPQWYQFEDESFGFGVLGKDGSFKPVETPPGAKMLDPRSLNQEKAFGTATGKATGEAAVSAPGDIATGKVALDLVNQIKTSPELGWATGTSAGMGGNMVPGTGRFGFQNLVDQAKSGAFLTAIQEMRGLGALSNAEGQAATQAITRMNTALSTQDFLRAVDDYERIVKTGMERAQARLSADGPVINPGAAPAQTSTGVQWSYEP
jgi:hypothetical protein